MATVPGNYTDYHLHFRGVFGRNRSEKLEITRIARLPESAATPTGAELQLKVDAALAGLKVKRGKWTVYAHPVEVGDVFECVSLSTLTSAPLLTGQVAQ